MQLQVTLQFESFEEMVDTLGRLEADRVQEIIPTEQPAPSISEDSESSLPEIDAAPAAVKLAEELGVGIYDVQGTGKGGRILKRDVQAHYDAGQGAPTEAEKAAEMQRMAERGADDAAPDPSAGDEMTLDLLREKFRALSQHEGQGPAAVLEVLEEFGASTLSRLSPDFYVKAASMIDKRLAG